MKGVAACRLRTISLTTSLMVGSKASWQTTFQGSQLKRKQSQLVNTVLSELHSLQRGPGRQLFLAPGLWSSDHWSSGIPQSHSKSHVIQGRNNATLLQSYKAWRMDIVLLYHFTIR